MSVAITVKQIQAKPFFAESSNLNIESALRIQLKLAKISDLTDMEPIQALEAELELVGTCKKFVIEVLQLTAKQQEKLDHVDYQETFNIVNYIALRLQGMTDDQIKESEEEDEKND